MHGIIRPGVQKKGPSTRRKFKILSYTRPSREFLREMKEEQDRCGTAWHCDAQQDPHTAHTQYPYRTAHTASTQGKHWAHSRHKYHGKYKIAPLAGRGFHKRGKLETRGTLFNQARGTRIGTKRRGNGIVYISGDAISVGNAGRAEETCPLSSFSPLDLTCSVDDLQ